MEAQEDSDVRLRFWLVAAFGAGALAALATLRAFAVTQHGANPYSLLAAFNVLRLQWYFRRALAITKGTINSVYRSARINELVGGVKPEPNKPRGSRHLEGCAMDLKPGRGISLDEAMTILESAANAGRLGPVVQLIKEGGWIHISWTRHDETPPAQIALLEQTASGFRPYARGMTA